MPRKSLTEGDSPRITLRLNHETQKILEEIDKDDKIPRSVFIREAIVHYASSSTYRSKISTFSYSGDSTSVPMEENEQPSIPVTVYKPSWQR